MYLKHRYLTYVVFLFMFVSLSSVTVKASNVVKVLGIGNSFTNNSDTYRQPLNDADPDNQLKLTIAYIGGCSLEKHMKLAEIHENNPADPQGKPYAGKSLKDLLLADKWDVVTIQQKSLISTDVKTYRPYAKELCDYVRKYCPSAQIVVHETWAYRSDDPLFVPGKDQACDMYRNLHNAYQEIAQELGNLKIIPTGSAFQNAQECPEWNFQPDKRYDFKHPSFPTLPDQRHSLNVGWFWKKDKNGKPHLLYDGRHAGPAGQFLAALVWRETLLGVDVRKNHFKPEGISDADAAILRQVAHKTVTENLLPKCLKTPTTSPANNKG